jgi:hypothetical protein
MGDICDGGKEWFCGYGSDRVCGGGSSGGSEKGDGFSDRARDSCSNGYGAAQFVEVVLVVVVAFGEICSSGIGEGCNSY